MSQKEPGCPRAGVPNLRIYSLMIWGGTDVIIMEAMCTVNVMPLNHPKPSLGPDLWENCLSWNQSLVPKRLGTTALQNGSCAENESSFKPIKEEPLFTWWLRHGSFSCVWLVVTPWTAAHQAPLSMGFSRQEYWSGLPCPPPLVILKPLGGMPWRKKENWILLRSQKINQHYLALIPEVKINVNFLRVADALPW